MNLRDICCNYNEEFSQFNVHITDIATNVKKLFLKAIVEIMHQVIKIYILVYEMYVQIIFIIETHFQKFLCTEKVRNFREFFGHACPNVRLECDFLSFLIWGKIRQVYPPKNLLSPISLKFCEIIVLVDLF